MTKRRVEVHTLLGIHEYHKGYEIGVGHSGALKVYDHYGNTIGIHPQGTFNVGRLFIDYEAGVDGPVGSRGEAGPIGINGPPGVEGVDGIDDEETKS